MKKIVKKTKQPSKSDVYRYFMGELFYDLKETALNTIKDMEKSKTKDDKTFQHGRHLAYYEVLDTIKNRLIIFQIPFKEVKFDIDPDRDLLNYKTASKSKKQPKM